MLQEQQATSSGGSRRKTSALAHYMMDPEMEYEKYGTQNKTKVDRIFGEVCSLLVSLFICLFVRSKF